MTTQKEELSKKSTNNDSDDNDNDVFVQKKTTNEKNDSIKAEGSRKRKVTKKSTTQAVSLDMRLSFLSW